MDLDYEGFAEVSERKVFDELGFEFETFNDDTEFRNFMEEVQQMNPEVFECKIVEKYREQKQAEQRSSRNDPDYDLERLNMCREFYSTYHRRPKFAEVYKQFHIGSFVNSIRRGFNRRLKEDVEKIFQIKMKSNRHVSDPTYKICLKYYKMYRKKPDRHSIFEKFNIGEFVNQVESGLIGDSEFRAAILNIFTLKLKSRSKLSWPEKINLCRKFYMQHHRVPITSDVIEYEAFDQGVETFNIGLFIKHCRYQIKKGICKYEDALMAIFGTKI